MNILYLAHRVPYPPNKGDKIRSYHHVRHLAERHDVHLLAFFDDPEDARWAAPLREHCREVVLVPLSKRWALGRGAYSLARGRSLSEGYFHSGAMARAVTEALASRPFDVAWAFSSVMAKYLPAVNAAQKVADFVDVDSEKWRQFGGRSGGPMRRLYHLESERLRVFESQVAGRVDRILFVSEAEASLFRTFCPNGGAVHVIPNGVDTTYFVARPSGDVDGPPNLLFTGALDYQPNIESVIFFTRQVLPLIRREVPAARLIAVGHHPSSRLLREAARHEGALSIAGSVPDIRPYFSQARVYVAPLHLGRGVQNKVLEAMAMRVPVVASPLAVAGLNVEPGRHALVCTQPEEFAVTVVSLLRDPHRCRQITDAAARLIEERYSWEENLKLVDECIHTRADDAHSHYQSQAVANVTTQAVATRNFITTRNHT